MLGVLFSLCRSSGMPGYGRGRESRLKRILASRFAGRERLGHSDSRTTRLHEMFHPFRLLRYRHEPWQSIQRRWPFVGVLHTDKSFAGNSPSNCEQPCHGNI